MNSQAKLSNDILILENTLIRREYRWNGGNLCSLQLVDKTSDRRWKWDGTNPDFEFPSLPSISSQGHLEISEQPAIASRCGYLKVEVTCQLQTLEIKKVFKIYEDVPAIACDIYLRGSCSGSWRDDPKNENPCQNIENPDAFMERPRLAPILERVAITGRHVKVTAIEFFDRTDYRNTLLETREILPYVKPAYLPGNVLLARDVLDQSGFFILKEAPCSDTQLGYPGFDFVVQRDHIQLTGIGLDPEDLRDDQWIRCYGFVTGVAAGTQKDLLLALRSYQHCIRKRSESRDRMILLNTWGDRSQDGRLCEAFVLEELEAAKKLGVTHLCLDDGWQKGRSPASVLAGGSFIKYGTNLIIGRFTHNAFLWVWNLSWPKARKLASK